MTLEIARVMQAGEIERERVVLKALKDCDIGRYAIFKARSSDEGGHVRSGNVPSAFWFEDKKVKAGDLVVLYSKAGTRSEKVLDTGSTTHFYYWGANTAAWGDDKKFTPVLVRTQSWEIYEK